MRGGSYQGAKKYGNRQKARTSTVESVSLSTATVSTTRRVPGSWALPFDRQLRINADLMRMTSWSVASLTLPGPGTPVPAFLEGGDFFCLSTSPQRLVSSSPPDSGHKQPSPAQSLGWCLSSCWQRAVEDRCLGYDSLWTTATQTLQCASHGSSLTQRDP